jgi:hypothetical protein
MMQRVVGWLVTTCLFGLLPVISRAFVWVLSNSGVEPVAISDLVAFGLVIHSSNIGEISRSGISETWKTVSSGFSVLFIVLYTLLLFTTIASGGDINHESLLKGTMFLGVSSFLLGLSVVMVAKGRMEAEA